ncbi:MAG: GGDEF domain-containing protein, partial [Chloroflexota bacterium]|nr:GGDEF domain-containing protein [Chloroflexota bacterium]
PSATAVALVVLYPAINYILLSGVFSLSTKRSMWRVGWDNFHNVAFSDIAMGVIGVLAATLWRSDSVAFAFLVLLAGALYGTVRGTQRIAAAEERAQEALVRVSMDERTGLPNRQTFQMRLAEEAARADPRRGGHSLSVLFVDIDDFRQINDTYGSQSGDAALRDIAALLKRQARAYDVVAYYGDDEFALILPETDIDGALEVAARIHERIAGLTVVHEAASFRLSISIGAAMAPMHGDSAPEVIRAAYRAVHAAKTAGKNRSIAANDPSITKEPKIAINDQAAEGQKNGDEGGGLVVRLSDHRR